MAIYRPVSLQGCVDVVPVSRVEPHFDAAEAYFLYLIFVCWIVTSVNEVACF